MKCKTDSKGNVFWHCPGCACAHRITDSWKFNGDLEKPTISPSVLNTYPDGRKCHCFVRGGKIQFLNDSFHKFAGQTVEIPDWHYDPII